MIIYNHSRHFMIALTRLNGETFHLNALLIEQIQSHPDTTITLTNGKKLIVKETETEVVAQTVHFYQQIGLQIPIAEEDDEDLA